VTDNKGSVFLRVIENAIVFSWVKETADHEVTIRFLAFLERKTVVLFSHKRGGWH
jgi:hypothetical protein